MILKFRAINENIMEKKEHQDHSFTQCALSSDMKEWTIMKEQAEICSVSNSTEQQAHMRLEL